MIFNKFNKTLFNRVLKKIKSRDSSIYGINKIVIAESNGIDVASNFNIADINVSQNRFNIIEEVNTIDVNGGIREVEVSGSMNKVVIVDE